MPLPMPEEEENLRCPHGERVQALMLCSLDCAVSGAHPDRKAKADGRFIITPWWCILDILPRLKSGDSYR